MGECTVLDMDLEKPHNTRANVSIAWVHGVLCGSVSAHGRVAILLPAAPCP